MKEDWTVPRIYVSSSSQVIGEARRAMGLVRERGWQVADWTDAVERHGSQAALPDDVRVAAWHAMVDAVRRADGLLLLTPEDPVTSEGAWVEVGVALGAGVPCVQVALGPRARFAVAGVPLVRSVAAALHALESAIRGRR